MKILTALTEIAGIYKIESPDGKIYIGKTKNFKARYNHYKYDYQNQRGDHINEYLMRAFDKHGYENFIFEIVEICKFEDLSEREFYYMDLYKTIERDKGYNLRMDSSSGMLIANETREKLSLSLQKSWARGDREFHGEKLKESWANNPERRVAQSKLFSEIKTKYLYKVIFPDGNIKHVDYIELKRLKLASAIAHFSKTKTDFYKSKKGYIVERQHLK